MVDDPRNTVCNVEGCNTPHAPGNVYCEWHIKRGAEEYSHRRESADPVSTDCAKCGCLAASHIPTGCSGGKQKCISCEKCDGYATLRLPIEAPCETFVRLRNATSCERCGFGKYEHVAIPVREAKAVAERIFDLVTDSVEQHLVIEPHADNHPEALAEIEKALTAYCAACRSTWIPIANAPRTGEHILATIFDGRTGFGMCGGKQQAASAVVHWWDNPGEEGWYLSLGNSDEPFAATHFQLIEQEEK